MGNETFITAFGSYLVLSSMALCAAGLLVGFFIQVADS